jgi:mannosyltransferase OCH1-like enzyme
MKCFKYNKNSNYKSLLGLLLTSSLFVNTGFAAIGDVAGQTVDEGYASSLSGKASPLLITKRLSDAELGQLIDALLNEKKSRQDKCGASSATAAAVQKTPEASVAQTFQDALIAAKKALKPVPEDEKNLYAKRIAQQKDPYQVEADFHSFIKKLRIEDGFVFKNETNQAIKLRVKLESRDRKGFYTIKKISIDAGNFHIFEQDQTILRSVKILNNPGKFLNPKFTEDEHLQISIEDQQDKFFLHQYHHFDFKSRPFTEAELTDSTLTVEEQNFRKDFNNHLWYIDQIFAKEEGTTLEAIDAQRRELYAKNNIAALVKKNPDLLDSADVKIPLITHKVWVTSDDKPVSLPNYYLRWLENSIKHNKVEDGWVHYLWIESKDKLPELAQKLENHPYIKVKELKDLDHEFVTGNLYKEAIKKKKFGKASDIIRLELLRLFGGYYLDTDYELFQSLKPYSKAYDLIMGVEPMSVLLCNAFMGARPDHPVINKSLEMIQRNHSTEAPNYIKANTDEGWRTIIETGPALVTAAFKHAAGQGDNVDIALPPQIIYPTPADIYPKKQVVKPNGRIPAEALGAHYWETAWMRAEFGSQG